MDKKKTIYALFIVILIGLFLLYAAKTYEDDEFLCAENGHNKSDDACVAIVGENGYYSNGSFLMCWNLDTGTITKKWEGYFGKLCEYHDALYYYNGEAVMMWNPLNSAHKILYQVPDGEMFFEYFLFHDMLFCLTVEGITVFDIIAERVLFILDDLSVINTTYAIMNDELYLLVDGFPQNSRLFKFNDKKQCVELLESGFILNLYNTGEELIYQRYQENWSNATWKVYQQGNESDLEIVPDLIIGTTSNGVVFSNNNYTKFSYWDGESVLELNVPVDQLESPHLAAYICTGTHLVIIGEHAGYVYSIALV